MSRPKGAPRALYRFEPEYSVQVAAVVDRRDEADMATARQITHDAALKHAGPRRRGGVTWTVFNHDDPNLPEFLDKLEAGEAHPFEQVRKILAIRGSALVVAFVPVWPSPPVNN